MLEILSPLLAVVLVMAYMFAVIHGVCWVAEKLNPRATVGEVGPWIIGIMVLTIVALVVFAY